MEEKIFVSEKILRKPDIREQVKLSYATVYRLEREGKFPQRIQLGGNSVGWIESEVQGWIKQKASERTEKSGG